MKCSLKDFFTNKWNLVWRGRKNVFENKLHHSDSEQHSDFEAEFLATTVGDHEGGQVQTQEEQDRQQEVGDVEGRSPLHVDLWNVVQCCTEVKKPNFSLLKSVLLVSVFGHTSKVESFICFLSILTQHFQFSLIIYDNEAGESWSVQGRLIFFF